MDEMEGEESPGVQDGLDGMEGEGIDGEELKDEEDPEDGANLNEDGTGSKHHEEGEENGSRQGKSVHESENGEGRSRHS